MSAWTTEDVYGDLDSVEDAVYAGIGGAQGAMQGVSLNGTHTVEQTGQHVAMIALAAVVVLVVFNRMGIKAAVVAGG